MTGDRLKRFRRQMGYSQERLATVIAEALSRKVDARSVGRWEHEERRMPREVDLFLDQLALAENFALDEPGDTVPPAAGEPGERDTAPTGAGFGAPPGPGPAQPALSDGGGMYAKVCSDLVDTIGTIVSTSGAILGSPAVVVDGQILSGDKEAWGEAFGKLAQRNDVFRRWLLTASQGGAWFEVALVVGATGRKVLDNHLAFAEVAAAAGNGQAPDGQPAQPAQPEPAAA